MPGSRRPTVAIVDDEPQLLRLFSEVLADDYRVREADSGSAALDMMDEDVDVLLLDRQMPGFAGEDVLQQIREAGYDIPIAMLTGKFPDFDVLEMGFDDYVLKPVDVDDLKELIEMLLRQREYDEAIREYFALASKLAALRSTMPEDVLESDERYLRAKETLEDAKQRAMRSLDAAFEAEKFEEVVQESASTERMFEDVEEEDESEFQFE